MARRSQMTRKRKKPKPKPKPWRQNPLWRSHSFAMYEHEWASIKEAAELSGVTTNAWIRGILGEGVLYERANAKDKETLDGTKEKEAGT